MFNIARDTTDPGIPGFDNNSGLILSCQTGYSILCICICPIPSVKISGLFMRCRTGYNSLRLFLLSLLLPVLSCVLLLIVHRWALPIIIRLGKPCPPLRSSGPNKFEGLRPWIIYLLMEAFATDL